jgi:Uma2 family endonuclease
MGMPDALRRWTRQEVLALPDDGNRYELIDGELLVSPSPRVLHQLAVWALYDRVAPFVRRHGIGLTGLAPADLDLRSDQLVQPDVFVVAQPKAGPLQWPDMGIPLLAVEVLSPSTARNDRIIKRARYQRSGVSEYWIVDLDARAFERWLPRDDRPEVLSDRITWSPGGAAESLVIDLADYFREAWNEPA